MRPRSTCSLALTSAALVLTLTACGSNSSTGGSSTAQAGSTAASVTTASASDAPSGTASASTAPSSSAGAWTPPAAFADIADQFVDFTPPTAGSGAGLKIGFINLDDSVPYHHAVGEGMKGAAEAAGAELVSCDAAGKAQQALQCAQSFRAQGVQGYVNAQLEAGAAAGICAAGPEVPVLSQDVSQAPCSTALYGVNNRFAGYLGGVALGNLLKEKTDCKYDAYVSEEAAAAGQLNTDRMGGYREGFASVCGPIHDERTVDAFRIDNAQTAFRDVLTALPAAQTIVVAAVDDDAVLGTLAAAESAGRKDAVWAMGQGADPSSWCKISTDEHYVGSVGYFPEKWGEIAVPTIIKMIKGEQVPANQFIKNEVVTQANIAQYYQPTGC